MGGDSDNNDRNLQPTNDDKEESCSDLMKKPLCLSSINADKTRPNLRMFQDLVRSVIISR